MMLLLPAWLAALALLAAQVAGLQAAEPLVWALAGRAVGGGQPVQGGAGPPPDRHGRPPPEVASVVGVLVTAAALPLPAGRVGPVGGGGRSRRGRPPVPSHPTPSMLRQRRVVRAVGAPVAVQLCRGGAPHRPLPGIAGDRAEFGQ